MTFSHTRTSFLAGSAAFALSGAVARAQAVPTPVHMAGSVNDDVTPMLIAIANGSMSRAGIDITLDKATSGSAVSSGVAGGSYQIGKSSVAGLITAHAKGVPFVFVAPGGLYESAAPVTALMVRSDSTAKSGADLNGKTVAVSAIGDLYTLALKGWVDQHGGDSTTLKLIEIPLSSVPAALEAARIDAGCLEEPEVAEALDSGKTRVLGRLFDSIGSRFMYTGWFSTLDWATQNRPLLDRFRAAFRAAAIYSNAHHAATVNISSTFTLIDPQVVAKGTRVTAATALDPKLIQPVIEACAKYKTIPASFDARDMIDPAVH
jgi:NitT/TauT family transport system substrate-binding protein